MKLPYSRSGSFASHLFKQFEVLGPCRVIPLSSRVARSVRIRIPAQQRHACRTVSNCAATLKKPGTDVSESNEQIPENTPSLSDQVRLLMRRVPYPVAIITATDPHAPEDRAFRGMTVSSFNTVTLNPEPVISFNVRRPSETLNAIVSSGRFLVHLLAPSDTTATLARDFSKGNNHLAILTGEGEFEFIAHYPDNISEGTRPLPVLRRKGQTANTTTTNPTTPQQTMTPEHISFPFVFECRLHPQNIEVHDHAIVLGTVTRTLREQHPLMGNPDDYHDLHQKGEKARSARDLCLTYANTRFWKMGHEI